jgi:hypothetical protein
MREYIGSLLGEWLAVSREVMAWGLPMPLQQGTDHSIGHFLGLTGAGECTSTESQYPRTARTR